MVACKHNYIHSYIHTQCIETVATFTGHAVLYNYNHLHIYIYISDESISLSKLIWARFLSLSWNVLRNCLSQDRSDTCLRSLAVSVFYLCLRQKIVLQIQIQVFVNTLAPIKYLIFLKTSMIKLNFIFMKCILILGNYCSIMECNIFFCLFVTQACIFYFQILRRVTCRILVKPVQLSQNVLRQLQVTGWADLVAV